MECGCLFGQTLQCSGCATLFMFDVVVLFLHGVLCCGRALTVLLAVTQRHNDCAHVDLHRGKSFDGWRSSEERSLPLECRRTCCR